MAEVYFRNLNTAVRIKRFVERVVDRRVSKLIPPHRYAVVTSVDTVTRFAIAEYPDEAGVLGAAFRLRMGGLEPSVGSLIRVAGPMGARYIDDVLTGIVTINNGGGGGGGGGGAATEAQFGFGGLVAPSAEARGAPYVMAAAHTFTAVVVGLAVVSASSYPIRVYVNGVLVNSFTMPASATIHTETVSIAVLAGDYVQVAIAAAPLATGENLLAVCR